MGVVLSGPYISHSTPRIRTDTIVKKSEYKDRYLVEVRVRVLRRAPVRGNSGAWRFRKGATEQNQCMLQASKTPFFWEEHLSPSSLNSENLEGLTDKVAPLVSKALNIIVVALPIKERGRPGLLRLLLGL